MQVEWRRSIAAVLKNEIDEPRGLPLIHLSIQCDQISEEKVAQFFTKLVQNLAIAVLTLKTFFQSSPKSHQMFGLLL